MITKQLFRKCNGLFDLIENRLSLLFQKFEREILLEFLAPNFTIAVIGANDGNSFDQSFENIKHEASQIVMYEPVPSYFEDLETNMKELPTVSSFQKAVVTSGSENLDIFYVENTTPYSPESRGYASTSRDHLISLGINEKDIGVCSVETISINEILVQHDPDYLQTDCEGMDYELINSIDFQISRPSIIKFEILHMSHWQFAKLKIKLSKFGYRIVRIRNKDAYAIRY